MVIQDVQQYLWSDIRWLFIWLVVGIALGVLIDQVAIGVIIGLMSYIIRFWRAVYQLNLWIKQQDLDNPPSNTGVLSDLTKRVQSSLNAERQSHLTLSRLIKRTRDSLSQLEEAIVLINADNGMEWWNNSARSRLKLTRSDHGRSVFHLIRHPDFERYFFSGDYRDGIRLQNWYRDDAYLQLDLTQFGEDKLLIVKDVTRIHHLEQTRKDFVANVSHELRTPLTVLMGYLETLSDQSDFNPRWDRAFRQMQQQARRMNNLVNDLLLLSRIESEGMGSRNARIDMPHLMTRIFDDAQAFNNDHQHMIHLHIDSQADIIGAEKEISSAFTNLVTNAMKYTPEGGEITIHWYDDEDKGYFSVTDTGIGIAPSHLSRLTERFYRVDSGRSRETGGTGLGLAIVKHILQQHNAELEVRSIEGEGSTFTAVFHDILHH